MGESDGVIPWHSDGVPCSELIPLRIEGVDGGDLMIYQGHYEEGLARVEREGCISESCRMSISHSAGYSTFGQYMRLLHSVSPIRSGSRVTLNLNLRSKDKPYIDDNNLRKKSPLASVIGLDIADQAISYAKKIGFIDHGLVYNLELCDPDLGSQVLIETADLRTITGGISYITSNTFRRLFSYFELGKTPTIIWFSLSLMDINPIIQTFENFGIQTIKSNIKFPQRRIHSNGEGLPTGSIQKLDDWVSDADYLYAALYISRHDTNSLGISSKLVSEFSYLSPIGVHPIN